jgi:CRISPR/Cas system-associated exonuclease Cas4 (RecB family)
MIALVEGPKESVSDILEEPVSASRINCFHSCRQKFFFRYVQKIQKPASAALHVGKAVHHALQQWSKRRWLGELSDADSIKEEFTEGWKALVDESPVEFPEGEETTQRDKAWGLVEMYLRETPIPHDEKPEAVEVLVESDLSQHGLPTLRGVIDLVRPGGVIVDYKTTATTPNEDQVLHRNEIQLTAYSLLHEEASGLKAKGMELHHLVKTKMPKLVVTRHRPAGEKQQSKLFRAIESYLGGVQREDWVPSPGLQCASCEYFRECREGGGL